ncbi:MAG: acetyl-CoA carboxylase biotin carboxylase subunit [Verrucomicrobia bacterium]|nr:acetyl-CoA carboxylase biotin carboxylase subunit [Verrucomicrobiota bacterium]MBU4290018.1 acetyl-CoA carboxylase biotin carboxylase subunit [Verrucomicrobiota bacterium]MBU4430082.1 acetyl-CoA carboxylase biotin carboxylase subunit [Verrucomicrobiota bacterium]MCG2679611.1 acetyl-CoA carboxylase biotin carboxylase subunit [Kiritimatiellia bacterium]
MFNRILIANRGEIALRIIRACREMGVKSIAIYSDVDEHSLHVQMADEAICIGPAPATESYLKIANIISAAEVADVDAIHPGYGFLSENAHFVQICESCNIKFIGPTSDNIKKMGDKAAARETMRKCGVPTIPGSQAIVKTQEEALDIAHSVGYPVLIKAAAGGGGKGLRVAHNDVSLVQGFIMASAEAERAFGRGDVYIEKFLDNARHVEIQIMADHYGNVVHLGERDCSIQRRHQKLLEESPCPVLTADQRKRMGRFAVKAAECIGYRNAGTIEFLLDAKGNFYFMEMNTRIQVEHPVTEMVTGIDLVKEQIRVAAGERLSFDQKSVNFSGHAIEWRVNAEDPFHNFSPSPGRVEWLHFPGGLGVRVDSAVYNGYEILPHYDSMIAKIIVRGDNREEAINRMSRALGECLIDGPKTTIPLGQAIMNDSLFRRGRYNTSFLDNFLKDGLGLVAMSDFNQWRAGDERS